ncbi:MAG: hypothetical protein WCG27_02580 [Pseudomonadota bacterium]
MNQQFSGQRPSGGGQSQQGGRGDNRGGGGRGPGGGGGNSGGGGRRNDRYNRFRKFRGGDKRDRPKSQMARHQSVDKIVQKYYNLLEQHNIARRKYFEWHGRSDITQEERFEKLYYATMEELRRFEKTLSPFQRDQLSKRLDPNPPDFSYSQDHQLSKSGEPPAPNLPVEDPHRLPTQQKNAFRNDTEESKGTIEDYKKLKNLT